MDQPPAPEEEEYGLSLEELGQTYAQMLGQGAVPYQQPAETSLPESSEDTLAFDPVAEELLENDQCPVTPLSILEAVCLWDGQTMVPSMRTWWPA